MTVNALSKSNGIQNLKITNLCRHLLFDSSKAPALLAGVDDADDKDASLAGVPVPNTTIVTNNDDDSDAESDHNSIDPNEANDNSSKASVQSTGSHIPVHSTTSEPPQHPPDEEKPDDIELPKLPYCTNLKEFLSHHPATYPRWEARHMSQMYKPDPVKMKTKV